MIIKCNIELKDLPGNVLKDTSGEVVTLGKALGNILLQNDEGGKMKLMLLASQLYQKNNVEVDEADLALIKNSVKNTKVYNGALVPGQCESLLEDVKPSKKEK